MIFQERKLLCRQRPDGGESPLGGFQEDDFAGKLVAELSANNPSDI